jgi:hypothetical protein
MKTATVQPRRRGSAPSWSAHQIRLLAVHASVDPRTAKRWLFGQPLSSTCAARLTEAWKWLHGEGQLPDVPGSRRP